MKHYHIFSFKFTKILRKLIYRFLLLIFSQLIPTFIGNTRVGLYGSRGSALSIILGILVIPGVVIVLPTLGNIDDRVGAGAAARFAGGVYTFLHLLVIVFAHP